MNKLHMTAIAVIVAVAVAVGGVAISSSVGSGASTTGSTQTVGSQAVADRTASLDALEASLDRQLAESASTGAPVAQPTGPPVSVASGAGHDEDDDHGGWEHDDDHGSDDD
jgi:hypothetical protein